MHVLGASQQRLWLPSNGAACRPPTREPCLAIGGSLLPFADHSALAEPQACCAVSQSTRRKKQDLAVVVPFPANCLHQSSYPGINQRLAFLDDICNTVTQQTTLPLPAHDGFQRNYEGHAQGTGYRACLQQQSRIQYSTSSFRITSQCLPERSRRINDECQQTEAIQER
jgi:hypothetical protein